MESGDYDVVVKAAAPRAEGRRLAKGTGAVLALVLLASGCGKTTPTEPVASTQGVLILSFSARCASPSALVFVDGVAVGRVQLPGALSLPVAAGRHTLSAGSSPNISFEMPPNGSVTLTNAPAPCP